MGGHMDSAHPGWKDMMQKLRNGIDLEQTTIEEIVEDAQI